MPDATNAIDGARVYFEDDLGEGPAVVVLGGFLDPVPLVRRAPMARALSASTEGFRTIYIDHRGHGRSDKPHDPAAYAMRTRVADVVAVLDAIDVDAAHMMGLSWGGRLSFGIGEHAPERARSLVVVGQQPYAIDPDGPLARVVGGALGGSDEPRIEPLIEAFEGIAGRYPDDVRALYLASDPAAMRAAWLAVLAEGPVSERLGEWRIPVLLCIAAYDADFLEQARRAADEIPDAELVIVPDTDHLGMDVEDVGSLWPAVLRTLSAGGAGA